MNSLSLEFPTGILTDDGDGEISDFISAFGIGGKVFSKGAQYELAEPIPT